MNTFYVIETNDGYLLPYGKGKGASHSYGYFFTKKINEAHRYTTAKGTVEMTKNVAYQHPEVKIRLIEATYEIKDATELTELLAKDIATYNELLPIAKKDIDILSETKWKKFVYLNLSLSQLGVVEFWDKRR